jgi:hypothetical protein
MIWSQLVEIQAPPIVTTDFLYLGSEAIEIFKKKMLVECWSEHTEIANK